ncbi:MAG: thioredoxin domain-containing protein [Chloroflexi bacterium]|nr:thioredoxin domain-containing protein [Chloroflexota bacterium]MCY3587083.1 thioredoxin domain-containing protein [Chloroflexota bacterium]MCY3685374.1 thioredoxin domain-containing protein [Chloroflexota bacterium]MDE2707471.1 thioredoxin domain-containing protein [Chloroflexota bacterium]
MATQVEPRLIEEYVRTGIARFQFVNIAYVGVASERVGYAMVCAIEQSGSAFWRFHDRFLVENSRAASRAQLIDYAGDIGLDGDRFEECYDDPATRQAHNQNLRDARAIGITYGPRIRVNGAMAGTSFAAIQQAVEAATP